ncbi:MAG: putative metalloprotease CJM1_0395 family protein [Desulfosoma sp.]
MIQPVDQNPTFSPFDRNATTVSRHDKVQNLSEVEIKQVQKLQQRDREVRAHEQAHIVAGGRYVRGAARFEYQRGPDGKLYAIGGEVTLDISPVPGDPQATMAKMQVVKQAALAPAQPSTQDRVIASKADMEIQKARQELLLKKAHTAYSREKLREPSEVPSVLSVYS